MMCSRVSEVTGPTGKKEWLLRGTGWQMLPAAPYDPDKDNDADDRKGGKTVQQMLSLLTSNRRRMLKPG
jgi:hypothetical protein